MKRPDWWKKGQRDKANMEDKMGSTSIYRNFIARDDRGELQGNVPREYGDKCSRTDV